MQLVDQTETGGPLIRAVSDDGIRIGSVVWKESFLIQPGHEVARWPAPVLADFDAALAATLLERTPALVILGSGAAQAFAPPAFAARLLGAGVGLETMPNAAAARTFNLLVSEGRDVLGAFLMR